MQGSHRHYEPIPWRRYAIQFIMQANYLLQDATPFSSNIHGGLLSQSYCICNPCKIYSSMLPSRLKETPTFINKLKGSILVAGQMAHLEVRPFVLRIHFPVQFSEATLKRIYASNNLDIKYYLDINPDFINQMGVITIVPVRWFNIIANIWKAMIIRPFKKARHSFSRMFI